jgi:hypothetical protein
MSVVTDSGRRRWAAVAGTVLLLTIGYLAIQHGAPVSGATAEPPRETLRRAMNSSGLAYTALGETRGGLALPSLPRLGTVSQLLGGTTKTRIWWAPERWRVDVVTVTGEQGWYGSRDQVVGWDYERRRVQTVVGEPGARLPRPDDLLPPQAVRRLLAGVGPADAVEVLPVRRVDGRQALGVRVRPSDRRSTIGRLDVWIDRSSGLPLRLQVVDRAGLDALVTQLTDVHLGRPPASVTTPPAPAAVRTEVVTAPDLAAAVDQSAPWQLPDTLAGLPATRPVLAGTATYGSGLARFTVLPLPWGTGADILSNAKSAGASDLDLAGGTASVLSAAMLAAEVVQDDDGEHAYLLTGPVLPEVLTEAARQLIADPPPRRSR